MNYNATTILDSPRLLYDIFAANRHILVYSIDDLLSNSRHVTPVYTLDFSVMASTLFNESGENIKEFVQETRAPMTYITSQYTPNESYVVGIGGPFLYEFLDQLRHKADHLGNLKSLVPNLQLGDLNRLIRNYITPDSRKLLELLYSITLQGIADTITAPVQRLDNLITKGVLHGIGDYIKDAPSVDPAIVKTKVDALVREMADNRLSQDRRYRTDEDSMFHYKMDAVNIATSLYYDDKDHAKALYLTKEWQQIEQCKTEPNKPTRGRHFMTPVFLTNTRRLQEAGYINSVAEQLSYLKDLYTDCCNIMEKLAKYRNCETWDGISNYIKEMTLSFYAYRLVKVMSPLVNDEKRTNQDTKKDMIEEITQSKKNLLYGIERAEDYLRQANDTIANYDNKLFATDMFMQLGLGDDPVLKNIMMKLRLDG